MHAEVTAAAKASSVSISEYIRQAIKTKLGTPEPPHADLFNSQPIYTEGTSREAGSAGNAAPPGFREPVPNSDKTTQEYWLERIRQWATMDGNQARAELLQSTGGVMPPMYLFSEADKLAKWLTENGKQ